MIAAGGDAENQRFARNVDLLLEQSPRKALRSGGINLMGLKRDSSSKKAGEKQPHQLFTQPSYAARSTAWRFAAATPINRTSPKCFSVRRPTPACPEPPLRRPRPPLQRRQPR